MNLFDIISRFSLSKQFSKIRSKLWTIYFNFHYLPFKQAIRLPIVLHKPNFIKLNGTIRIEGPITKGMIELGRHLNILYPDNGITFENLGGEIIFRGKAKIAIGSAISVGPNGRLEMGDGILATAELRLVCYHHICLHDDVRLGWESVVMDTGFHRLKDMDGNFINNGYAPIELSHNTWISSRCMVMQGAKTAPYKITASNSLINKKYDESYVLLAGAPAVIKKRGIWRDFSDDEVIFPPLK